MKGMCEKDVESRFLLSINQRQSHFHCLFCPLFALLSQSSYFTSDDKESISSIFATIRVIRLITRTLSCVSLFMSLHKDDCKQNRERVTRYFLLLCAFFTLFYFFRSINMQIEFNSLLPVPLGRDIDTYCLPICDSSDCNRGGGWKWK
jgi:hypothetical protein